MRNTQNTQPELFLLPPVIFILLEHPLESHYSRSEKTRRKGQNRSLRDWHRLLQLLPVLSTARAFRATHRQTMLRLWQPRGGLRAPSSHQQPHSPGLPASTASAPAALPLVLDWSSLTTSSYPRTLLLPSCRPNSSGLYIPKSFQSLHQPEQR